MNFPLLCSFLQVPSECPKVHFVALRFNYNYMSLCVRKPTIWIPTMSDTNRAAQSQKMVRGSKLWISKVEELYYPCSGNKGADQLRMISFAVIAPLFSPMQIVGFPMRRIILYFNRCPKVILLRGPEGLTMHPPRILWEWYNIVHWASLIKNQDVNTRYLGTETPFWTVFKMAAMQKWQSACLI